jgi:hypothetical protein
MAYSRPSTPLDLVFAALLAICGVIFAIYMPLAWAPPDMKDLVPAEGRLLRYSVDQSGTRASHVALITLEGHPGRFWNDALKGAHADLLRGKEGSTVRVLYAPHSRYPPLDRDAVKSYGLWVNGVRLASPASALRLDRFLSSVLIPVFGVGMSCVGCWRYLRVRRELRARGSAMTPDSRWLPPP